MLSLGAGAVFDEMTITEGDLAHIITAILSRNPLSEMTDKTMLSYAFIPTETKSAAAMFFSSLPVKDFHLYIRPSEDSTATMLTGYVGYTKALTDHIISKTNESDKDPVEALRTE